MRKVGFFLTLLILAGCDEGNEISVNTPPALPPFETVATFAGLGIGSSSMVGSGPTEGSQRFYIGYTYHKVTFDLVAVDPHSGQFNVYPSPLASEYGIGALAVGPEGAIYVGAFPNAHLLRFDPQTGSFIDLGQPVPGEIRIHGLAVGTDGNIYGGTAKSATLFRYDPVTEESEELWRDPANARMRRIVASNDGFIYMGVGDNEAHLVAYEIGSGTFQNILPPENQLSGAPLISRRIDGTIYATSSGVYHEAGGPPFAFAVQGWQLTPVSRDDIPPHNEKNVLADGQVVRLDTSYISAPASTAPQRLILFDPQTGQEQFVPFGYDAVFPIKVFRLANGPDGIYGSTKLPAHLYRLLPDSDAPQTIGNLGPGQIYLIFPVDAQLLLVGYGTVAPLMLYDPARPLNLTSGPEENPFLIYSEDINPGWRSKAVVGASNGKVYVGSSRGRGELGGTLTEVDPVSHDVRVYSPFDELSVVSLATIDDLIVGGTSIEGNGGAIPAQSRAKLFIWDPQTQQTIYETVPPVSGKRSIDNLFAAPNGLVYGITNNGFFVFDPQSRQMVTSGPLPFNNTIYGSLVLGPDGNIWGLSKDGIFTIDTQTDAIALVAQAPEEITAGIVLDGTYLYFASKATIYRYRIDIPSK